MYFLIICTLLFALSEAKQTYVDMPPKLARNMLEKSIECIAETGVDKGIMQRVFSWQYENNESSKKFYECLFKRCDMTDDTGHFIVKQVLGLYEYSDQKDGIAKASEECNKIVAENPHEAVYQSLLCFRAKTPVLLSVKTE